MTYKKIVEGLVERESKEWLEIFVDSALYFEFVGVEFTYEKNGMTYMAEFEVYHSCRGFLKQGKRTFVVGGFIDDIANYKSVIFEKVDGHREIRWTASPESRKTFECDENFRIV